MALTVEDLHNLLADQACAADYNDLHDDLPSDNG
jgi:hypothetical protein